MDPISDMLTRIRNSVAARHEKVDIPLSDMKEGIAKVLKDNGLISNFRVVKDSKQGIMRIYLKYDHRGLPAMSVLKRESSPGRRVYVKSDRVPVVRSGMGLAVLSTSQGVISGNQAREQNVGGELLCSIW